MVTDKKRALRFAEYMAKDAERYMDAVNALDLHRDCGDEGLIDGLVESMSEAWLNLRNSIYEFRKRAGELR